MPPRKSLQKESMNEKQIIKIGEREVGPARPVYVIAEMSANHNQDFEKAVKIIEAAKDAGAENGTASLL